MQFLSSADWQGCPSGPAAHRTRGCHTAGWQVLTCARSQLGFDAAIRIRVVVVCRNPRLEQHRGGRRVVVRWTRGLAVCAWLGSLFSVEGAVQKAAVVDTVVSQRGGLRCAQRSWSRAQVPSCYPGSDRCPFRTVRTHPAGAAASSPGRTGAVRERTCGRRATRGHGCCVVCAGGLVVCKRWSFFLTRPHQKGPGCPFCEKSLLGCSCMTFFFILLCLLQRCTRALFD